MTDNINLQVNLLNLDENSDEECMICKESLSQYPCYKLPECNHIYHTHCIIAWFRNGDSRCPYCGNKGINHTESKYKRLRHGFHNYTSYEYQYISDLKRYANLKINKENKNAISIKNKLTKINELEDKLKINTKEMKEYKEFLKNNDTNFNDTKKKLHEYRCNKYKIQRCINSQKFNLINNSYIVPLIVPRFVNL